MAIVKPVVPQIALTTSSFDALADDRVSAFAKYNVHEHSPVIVNDFTAYDIKLGDEVYVYDLEGNELFVGITPAQVDYITTTQLRVNISAERGATAAYLYVGESRSNTSTNVVYGVSVEQNSQIITFSSFTIQQDNYLLSSLGRPGFITPHQIETLTKANLTVSFTTKPGQTRYLLTPYLGFDAWLLLFSVYCVEAAPNVYLETLYQNVITQVSPSTPLELGITSTPLINYQENLELPTVPLEYPEDRPQRPLLSASSLWISFVEAPEDPLEVTVSLVLSKVVY